MSITTGTQFGGYEILAQIGAGGMGEVYRVRDIRLQREVAIKVLVPQFVNDRHLLIQNATSGFEIPENTHCGIEVTDSLSRPRYYALVHHSLRSYV